MKRSGQITFALNIGLAALPADDLCHICEGIFCGAAPRDFRPPVGGPSKGPAVGNAARFSAGFFSDCAGRL